MQILKRLFGYVTPYWKILILSAVLLVGRAGMELVPPLFQKAIVDQVIVAGDLSRLAPLIGLLVVVYALIQLIRVADNYVRHSLGERFILTCGLASTLICSACRYPSLSAPPPAS